SDAHFGSLTRLRRGRRLTAAENHAHNYKTANFGQPSRYRVVELIFGTAGSTCTRSTHTVSNYARSSRAGLCPDRCGMETGRFYRQRRQDGHWDRGGLHPTNYGGYATTSAAGHEAFATNRPAACGGVQAGESELRNGAAEITAGRTANQQTVDNAATM